ncbi:MAG: Rieske 2Fe-2S domain-containing protein [Vicinamibacterales bacterium]
MGARGITIGSRRAFLAGGAAAVVGFSGAVRAQVSRLLRYRPLAQPVVVPLDALSVPWRVRPFTAEAVTLPSAATPNQPIRVSGMIVRTAAGDRPQQFSAVCVRCPHELCDVDYVDDPKRLPTEIVNEIGRPVSEPVYVCPCHNSTFKVDGDRLSGPAPRGLYRFRVTGVSAAAVEIAEVEEDVLIFL